MSEENIYLVLNTFKNSETLTSQKEDKPKIIGYNDFLKIIGHLEDREFIKPTSNLNEFKITSTGIEKFKELDKLNKITEKDKNIQRRKLYNESIIAERARKTFWFVFLFGLFGGIYSGIDIFNKITKSKEVPKKQVTKQEMEEELSKLRTLFLTQKKVDSLNHSNSELNK